MNISLDGVIVFFKTLPEDLYLAEMSGAKANTVRIIDEDEFQQLRNCKPQKIVIESKTEIFLRTLTHIHISKMKFGKYIAIFSWTNEQHHHNETDFNSKSHTMSLDATEPPIDMPQPTISISRELLRNLDLYRGKNTHSEYISKLINAYATQPHCNPLVWVKDQNQTGGEDSTISISRELLRDLDWYRGKNTHSEYISKLINAYIIRPHYNPLAWVKDQNQTGGEDSNGS